MEQLKDDLAVFQDVLEHDFGVTEISEKNITLDWSCLS